MTKEMRRQMLKVFKDWMPELELVARYNANSIDYDRYSMINNVIKALEQESCEDCISRKKE